MRLSLFPNSSIHKNMVDQVAQHNGLCWFLQHEFDPPATQSRISS